MRSDELEGPCARSDAYTLLTERHARKLQIPSPSFLKLEKSKPSKRVKATVSLHNSPGLVETATNFSTRSMCPSHQFLPNLK